MQMNFYQIELEKEKEARQIETYIPEPFEEQRVKRNPSGIPSSSESPKNQNDDNVQDFSVLQETTNYHPNPGEAGHELKKKESKPVQQNMRMMIF